MTDIINLILNSNNKPDGMPAEAFLTDNNPHGYMSIQQVTKMFGELDKRELVFLDTTLEHIKSSVPFDSVPSIDFDKDGKPCIWLKARLARSNQNLRIPGEEGLLNFIKDYLYGKISPKFSLSELYNLIKPDETVKQAVSPPVL